MGDIGGQNDWTSTTTPEGQFQTSDGGRFFRGSGSGATIRNATRSASVTSGDTTLRIATFFRGREGASSGTQNRVNQLILTAGGSPLLTFGTGQGGDLATGTGLTFTAGTSSINPDSHTFYYLELLYDEVSGAGTALGATRANGGDTTDTTLENFGSFTGAIDVDSIDGIGINLGDGGGFHQEIGISTAAIPEPTSVALGLFGLAGLAGVVRRRG